MDRYHTINMIKTVTNLIDIVCDRLEVLIVKKKKKRDSINLISNRRI